MGETENMVVIFYDIPVHISGHFQDKILCFSSLCVKTQN